MKEEIFRKKSLDKVKSPENMDDYICVSNPGVWLLLVSVIVLLAGACIWGIYGHIDSTVPVAVSVESGNVVCYVSADDISDVKTGLTVKFLDSEAAIIHIGDENEQGYVCTLSEVPAVPDGFYEGTIVIESFKPLSFILN